MLRFFLIFPIILGALFFFFGVSSAKAEILIPDGAGFYSDWINTLGSGAGSFEEVNQYPTSDEDTTYNKASADLTKQSYSLVNTNKTQGTIKNIKVWIRTRTVSTANSIKVFLRINGNDYFSDPITPTASYANYYYQWNVNPFNSSNWSISDLNSLEAGFQLIGDLYEHRITQLYAQIEYISEINTLKYQITQEIFPITSGSSINNPFDFFIADDLDEIKSAYVEIKGVALPINPLTIDVSIDSSGAPYPTNSPRIKTYTINASGRILPFKLIYDTTDYFKTFVNDSGNYSKYFNLKISGDSVYVLNAKLIITYSWIKPPTIIGAYKTSGVLISSTFDTQVIGGAGFNSIMWTGALNNGRVKLQFTSSNCSNGADNPPDCNNGIIWGIGPSSYIGGNDCSSASHYEPLPDSPMQLKCYNNFNNKRYFRYKITVCSNDCVSAGANTPQINDIIVNYSP